MSQSLPLIPFISNPQKYFTPKKQRNNGKGFLRLLQDTKSYVFQPLIDDFERENQANIHKLEQQGITNDIEDLWTAVSALRQNERKVMIEKGYLDDENSKRSLDHAISFRGTCTDMCPSYERIKRTRQNNVNVHEKDSISGFIDRNRAIKSFSRPAAGQEPPLPSDVRPPNVLVNTLDYIIDNLLDQMPETQSFIWDRTRSIRQDFTFQNYFGPEAIECNEKIVRIHIMSLHIMANSDIEYSQQQELEQLEKSLKTLAEIYDEYRKKGFPQPPNEAEFRAYHLLLKINDPDLQRHCERLPGNIFDNKFIQIALLFRRIFSVSLNSSPKLYSTFFETVLSPEIPFLVCCLLEIKFNDIWLKSLKAIFKANHNKTRNLSLPHLFQVLKFPEYERLKSFLDFYNVNYTTDDNGIENIDMNTSKNIYKTPMTDMGAPKHMKSAYDFRLNNKVNGLSRRDLINGGGRNNFKISKNSFNAKQLKSNGTQVIDISNKFANTNNNIILEKSKQDQGKIRQLEQQRLLELQRIEQEKAKIESKRQELLEKKRAKEDFLKKQKEEQQQKELLKQQEERVRRAEIERKKREEEERIRIQQKQAIILQQQRDAEKKAALKLSQKKAKAFKLSEELLQCFLNEIVYETTMDLVADKLKQTNLKKLMMKKIFKVAKRCKQNLEKKQRKKDELIRSQNLLGFGSNVNKYSRRLGIIQEIKANSSVSIEKPENSIVVKPNNDEILKKIEKQYEIFEKSFVATADQSTLRMTKEINPLLWNKIDLSLFAKLCLKNTHFDQTESVPKSIKVLFSINDWQKNSSKWLIEKFGFSQNLKTKCFQKTLNINGKLPVQLTSYDNSALKETAFLIFECGFDNDSKEDYKNKLKKDGEKLLQLLDFLNSKSLFKYQILLLFWQDDSIKVSESEIYNLLSIDIIKTKFKNNLIDLLFCPINLYRNDTSNSVDELILKAFNKMAKHFHGFSSTNGLKKVVLSKKDYITKGDPAYFSLGESLVITESVNHETSVMEQHPYYRKQRLKSSSMIMPRSRNTSMIISKNNSILNMSRKRIASGKQREASKKVKPEEDSFVPKTNTTIAENPLAQSSMIFNDFKKSNLSFINDTTMNTTYNNTTNHSFSILQSRFNRISKPNPANLSRALNTSFVGNNTSRLTLSSNFSRRSSSNLKYKPNRTKITKPISKFKPTTTPKNVPNNLLELKNLISSVKSKYNKP